MIPAPVRRAGRDPHAADPPARRIGIVIAACLVTLQSVLLVLGRVAQRPADRTQHGRGGRRGARRGPRRSTIEFVTPDRVTYRPELGVLYPSELDTGMRIYVEYDKNNPDLVRVQDRNASLAIIPAGSIAVVGWLVAGAALSALAHAAETRHDRQADAMSLDSQSLS